MKPFLLRAKILLFVIQFLFLYHFQLKAQQQPYPTRYAADELQIIDRSIKNYHPNPFRYISEEEWNKQVLAIQEAIDKLDIINMFEFISLASPLVSSIRDEHSNLYPQDEAWDQLSSGQKFFPFELSITADSNFVVRAASDPYLDTWVGQEITSINRRTSKRIILTLKTCGGTSASSDYSGTLYHAFNYDNFGRLYFLCMDQSGFFEVQFTSGEKMTFEGFSPSFEKEKAVIYKLNPEPAPVFRMAKDSSLAYLKVSTFWPPRYKQSVNKAYKELEDIFSKIQEADIDSLVIDVRGNRGGTPFLATYLASFFFDQPFCPIDRVTARRKSADDFPDQFRGVRKPSPSGDALLVELSKRLRDFETNHKASLIYQNNVTVLIDAGTGSAASIFSSLMSRYERVTFVGQETLGDASKTTGGQFHTVKLPYSETELTIPLLMFHHGPEEATYGIRPDRRESLDSFPKRVE